MKNFLLSTLALVLLIACQPKQEQSFSQSIADAHGIKNLPMNKVLSFDFSLEMGPKKQISGSFLVKPDFTKIRYEKKGQRPVVVNNGIMTLSDAATDSIRARFDVYTWPYFALLPFKLDDPGTRWSQYDLTPIKNWEAEKLTFETGIGDTPDDWYVVYANEENLLSVAAYIVTYNKDINKEMEDPHAIIYENYTEVEGVKFATDWTFTAWREGIGLTDTLGTAVISNIKFVPYEEGDFTLN